MVAQRQDTFCDFSVQKAKEKYSFFYIKFKTSLNFWSQIK